MKQRVITALALIPLVLLAVFVDHILPIYLLALVAYVIGALELGSIARSGGRWMGIVGLAVLALSPLLIVHFFYHSVPVGVQGVGTAVRILAGSSMALSIVGTVAVVAIAKGTRGILVAEVASLWLCAGLLALVALHGWPSNGIVYRYFPLGFIWASPTLLALIPLWIGDTLAIFAGKAFGKHPLAPKISPKKTVEGGIANLLGCIAGAIGISALIHQPLMIGVLAGIATGVLGQAGDLLESAMKRSAGVKDSGTLLPGHGGLLDRIDSILLSAPVVALIVVFMGR